MTSEQIKNILPVSNHVLVRPFVSEAAEVLMGGKKLMLDTTFEKEKNAATTGEIIRSCESIYFNREDGEMSCEYDTTVEVRPGDTVYYHYLCVDEAESKGMLFKDENQVSYMAVPYERLFCVKRGDELVMLNGWILMEPVLDQDTKEPSLFELPDYLKDKHSLTMARIYKTGSPLKGYLKKYDDIDESNIVVNEGDLVFYTKNSDIQLQSEIQSDLDGSNKFFRMQRKDFVAIADESLILTK